MDKTRMQRYVQGDSVSRRSIKNKKIYDDVSKININYVDIDVNNAVSLDGDIEEPKTRADYQRKREINSLISNAKVESKPFEQIGEETKNQKIYDINEILKDARANKLFESNTQKKRLINTEYNILTKLDLDSALNKDDYSKETLRNLIDQIYIKEQEIPIEKDMELLDELRAKDFEVTKKNVSKKLKEEQKKQTPIERELEKARQLHQDKEGLKKVLEESSELTEENKELTFADKVVENTFIEEIDKLNKLEVFFVVLIALVTLGVIGYVLYEMFIV